MPSTKSEPDIVPNAPMVPGIVTLPELTVVGPTIPPVAVNECGPSERHIVYVAGAIPTAVGVMAYFTYAVSDALHPFASVPTTVYTIPDVGLAITEDPVVAANPVDGLHT
jgi:hypothetical protein